MEWSYGITTIPERRETYLPRTVRSLQNAGFEAPIIFVDGAGESSGGLVCRGNRIRTFGNWFLALAELYVRKPLADRYVIFQDDMVTCKNLRQYLEQVPFPEKGYLNLLTMPLWNSLKVLRENFSIARANSQPYPYSVPDSDDYIGFYHSNQNGKGAVANVFDQAGVRLLFQSDHIFDKPKDQHKGHQCIDGAIISAMKKGGFIEYVHNPSLVYHIGDVSSMGHHKYPDATTFRGEDFDALDLLKERELPKPRSRAYTPIMNSMGWGDRVHSALEAIGITEERVEDWLGRACAGCAERRRRLNRLGWWMEEIFKGRVAEAKQRFEEMLGD